LKWKINCVRVQPPSVIEQPVAHLKEVLMTQEGSPKYWLRRNFTETLSLSDEASDWLIALWEVIQLFDDIADGDSIDRDDLDAAIWNALVGMPANGFYQRNAHVLIPLMSVAVCKWKASDVVEREGNACATSFVWRAGFYDLVLASVQIEHGAQAAMDIGHVVLKLYGETLEEYMKEMDNA